MKEIWKDIPWYEWLYYASTLGNIKSNVIKKSRMTTDWYLQIGLCKNSIKKTFRTHRLIMLTFKWQSKLQVNHKNWNKLDNRLVNLEYCTQSENQKHRYRVLWHKPFWWRKPPMKWIIWKLNTNSKKVVQLTRDNILIKVWDCMSDITRETWIDVSNISACCNWKRKTVNNFIFKFYRDV